MWDCEPVLYWRCKYNGKMTWRKAKAAFIPNMGMYAIEPPRPYGLTSQDDVFPEQLAGEGEGENESE